MGQIEQVTINSTCYNIARATAVNQQKLLQISGAKIALNSAAGKVNQIDTKLLVGYLLSVPQATFDQIVSIVLHKTFIDGSEDAVSVHDFQNRMIEYYTLVAEAVRVNLQDFFTWLDNENAKERTTPIQTPTLAKK